jgi:hypothetical protein
MKSEGGFMSEILEYLRASIRNYLSSTIDVDTFRAEFAGAYLYTRNKGSREREANSLASSIVGPIAEFSGGHRSEASLRKELALAVRSFEGEKPRTISTATVETVDLLELAAKLTPVVWSGPPVEIQP